MPKIGERNYAQLDMVPIKVMGVKYEGRLSSWEAAKVDDVVELKREPGNEHDSNAVGVHFAGKLAGYIPRELARQVAKAIDAYGQCLFGQLVKVDGESVWFKVLKPEEE